MTTVVTDWSYIAWAWSAESPASTIRAAKTSAPTTVTPMATMADARRAAEASAARAIRWRSRARMGIGRRGRPIADAADRGDVARLVGVVAELVAQAADVDVDRPVEDVGPVAGRRPRRAAGRG